MDMMDPTLSLQDDEALEVQRLINTALLCIQNAAESSSTACCSLIFGNSRNLEH